MNDDYFRAENGDSPGLFRLVGELDLGSVLTFRAAVEKAPAESQLTLDLAYLTYIDSSGIHAIIECANARDGSESVRIVNASAHVVRVLEIVHLEDDPRIVIELGGNDAR